MRTRNTVSIFLLAVFFALCSCPVSNNGILEADPGATKENSPRNAIIVVVDGARFSEAFGSMLDADAANDTFPKLWSLRDQGTLIDTFFVGNPSKRTETNAGHATIATGTYQDILNDGSQFPTQPTLFEYFRKQTGATASSCFVIMGKPKLKVIRGSTDPEYGESYYASASVWDTYVDNPTVWNRAKEILTQEHPNLAIINFPQTDVIGHGYFLGDGNPQDDVSSDPLILGAKNPAGLVYLAYQDELRAADGIIYELWGFIQSDAVYKDTTVLIVTADHGRHSDYCRDGLGAWSMKHHNGMSCLQSDDSAGVGTCEGVQHLIFFAIGAGIKENAVSITPRSLQDIAPTIGRLLGFSVPKATGVVMTEILK